MNGGLFLDEFSVLFCRAYFGHCKLKPRESCKTCLQRVLHSVCPVDGRNLAFKVGHVRVETLVLRNARPATGTQNAEPRNSSKTTKKLPPGPLTRNSLKNAQKILNYLKIVFFG